MEPYNKKFEIPKNQELEKKEELPENVVIIERPEGKFRIVYGMHSIEQDPKDIGNADALVLEMAGDYSDSSSAQKLLAYSEKFVQYEKIFKQAASEKKPIFLLISVRVKQSFYYNEG